MQLDIILISDINHGANQMALEGYIFLSVTIYFIYGMFTGKIDLDDPYNQKSSNKDLK